MSEKPSEHLRDMEEHAAHEGVPERDDPGDDMRPEGEPIERLDDSGPMKRIDEDVKGHEETEDMSDVEAGDGEAPSS